MSRRKPREFQAPEDGAKVFWKSLEEKRQPEAAAAAAELEFQPGAVGDVIKPKPEESKARLGRRGFLGLGAAGAALMSEGCLRRGVEHILPYTKAPEYVIPGVPMHYATVVYRRGEAVGALVESHEGRPTKVEGNPEHPTSLGSADLLMQGAIMDMYAADRSTMVREKGKKSSFEAFDKAFDGAVRAALADGGAKFRVLMQPTVSPTVMRLLEAARARLPHARVHVYAPVSESNSREGARIAFGQATTPLPDYRAARVILSLDSDFLQTEQGALRATKQFSRGRRVLRPRDTMSRLFVVEPLHTVTGANADHRLRLAAHDIETYARALAAELAAQGAELGAVKDAVGGAKSNVPEKWIKEIAKELIAHKGQCVVVAGRRQPAHVHALVHAMNTALDNVGRTVTYAPVVDTTEPPDLAADLKVLADDLAQGKVDTLLILGGNPVYDAPSDVKIADAIGKAAMSIHVASHFDETGEKVAWHVPMAHDLESWGDARAIDGTWSLQQPLIAPLFYGRTAIEVLAVLAGEKPIGHELVQTTFRSSAASAHGFEGAWDTALRRGFVIDSNSVTFDARATLDDVAGALKKAPAPKAIGNGNLEVTFTPCAKMHDGRHANNPWLQELPEPMTKIVWDNAALFSAKTAAALGLQAGDMVTISRDGAQPVEAAVWIQPGHPDDSVGLTLGWGRKSAGRYGNGTGFDAYPLRTTAAMQMADGVKVQKTGATYHIVQTQDHHSMEGRPLALDATIAQYRDDPRFTKYRSPTPKTLPLWDPIQYKDHKWGMSIDLTTCTGCNACVVACIAENNIAFVGKTQVYRGREMHWLRIDRYFVGDDETSPEVAFQPVACVQCEEAPCENVCPVNATSHSAEGLNDMTYNRCIGTRYCGNNCPYKVRRFNFLNWRGYTVPAAIGSMYGDMPETEKMAFNPNVTVRMRGVMEKCSYCTQRIEEAKIAARREDRAMRPNEIKTACQQTCPADAIVFGDLNNPKDDVTHLYKLDRSYALLAEVGTRPRTHHLGKIRNPNRELQGPAAPGEGEGHGPSHE